MSEEKVTEKTFELSDGRTATIIKGKGKHAINANRMVSDSGNADDYLTCLMAQLVNINGQPLVKEDLEEMDLADYMAIQKEFSALNFQLVPEK